MAFPEFANPVGLYFFLLFFRGFFILAGTLFSLPLVAVTSMVVHFITLVLLATEGVAAQFSRSPDLRERRFWTIANILLYFAGLVALVGCLMAPRRIGLGGHDFGTPRILYFPDACAVTLSAASFLTLPVLRIRNWVSLQREEGQFVGDSIPVAAYRDDEDEGGPLATAFDAQQDEAVRVSS